MKTRINLFLVNGLFIFLAVGFATFLFLAQIDDNALPMTKFNIIFGAMIICLLFPVLAFWLLGKRRGDEAVLWENERHCRALINKMLNGFALFEVIRRGDESCADLRYLAVNEAHERHTGLSREQVVGKTLRDLFPNEEDNWFKLVQNLSEHVTPRQIEFFSPTLGKWFEMTIYAPQEGQVAFIFSDISHQRMAHEKIQQVAQVLSKAAGTTFFSSLVESLATLLQAEFVFIGELIGDNKDSIQVIASYSHGKPADTFSFTLAGTPCAEVVQGSSCFCREGVAHRYPGNQLLDDMDAEGFVGVPLKLADGRVVGVLVILNSKPLRRKEVTESICQLFATRAATEMEHMQDDIRLQQSADKIRLIIDSVPASIAYVDSESRYRFANRNYARLFNFNIEELIGRPAHEQMGGHCSVTMRENIQEVLSGKTVTFLNRTSGADGQAIFLQTSYVPHLGQQGDVLGFFVQHLDITERKLMEDTLNTQVNFLQTLIDAIPSPIFYKDRAGRYLGYNRSFESYLGLPREQLIGKTVYDVSPKDLADKYHEMDEALFVNPGSQVYESSVIYADGSRHDVIFNKATFADKDGQVGGMVGVILDVTSLKQTERLLAAEKSSLELIVSETPLADVLGLLCTNIEKQSAGAFCSVLLLDDSGTRLRHVAAPSLPASYSMIIDGTRIGQNVGSCGTAAYSGRQIIASDIATDPHWAKYRDLPLKYGLRACWSTPILSAGRTVLGTFAVYYTEPRTPDAAELLLMEWAVDLASIAIERQRGAEALRQVHLHQRAILDNIPDLIWLKDKENRFVIVNKAFADACAMTPDNITGKTDLDIWPADLATGYRNADLQTMASGKQNFIEEHLEWSDGVRKWIETIKTPVHNDQGVIVGTTGIARDINLRKQAEEALRESEERFHRIFDQSDDAIILFQMDTFVIIDANPAAQELFGYGRSELLSRLPHQLIERDDFQQLLMGIESSIGASYFQLEKAVGIRKDASTVQIIIRVRILRLREEYVVHCSIRDITEKLHLEEEIRATQAKLIQANKMTSLGMLSSSVAHEINNPNNCIFVNASMLTDVWRDTEKILKLFHEENGEFDLRGVPYSKMQQMVPRLFHGITEGSRRINAIVDNMKDFVREDKSGTQIELDVNKIVRGAASILWHHIHKYTDNFQMVLQDDILPARGNGQQIGQVIINLLMNALQALPDKNCSVSITTSCDRNSGKIIIKVQDNGKGMSQSVVDHLREPFFTTRLDTGGTGLGLYISDSIMKEHRGSLEFASETGKGTIATIKLPAA